MSSFGIRGFLLRYGAKKWLLTCNCSSIVNYIDEQLRSSVHSKSGIEILHDNSPRMQFLASGLVDPTDLTCVINRRAILLRSVQGNVGPGIYASRP